MWCFSRRTSKARRAPSPRSLSEVQSLLNIFELIAVMVLFVDLVLRFDHIASKWQVPRVAAVGLCLTGMLFKWFILYLHLSYLVD